MNYRQLELPEEGLILVAGRPGIGKSYAMIEMANELNRQGTRSVLVYADGVKSHDAIRYENGEMHAYASKISRVKAVYPDLPYVIDDRLTKGSSYGWQLFLSDYLRHERPKAVFFNRIAPPGEKIAPDLLGILCDIAKEKHILIFAEADVSLRSVIGEDKRPTPRDVMCGRRARRCVDRFVFVHRNLYYDAEKSREIVKDSLEIYSSKQNKTQIPYHPEKYAQLP